MDIPEYSLHDSLVLLGGKAQNAGLGFLLVGGNALIHFGVPRFTRDIDFLIPESLVAVWKAFLEAEGWLCFHETDAFLQFDGKPNGLPPVDLMVVDEATWKSLLEAASPSFLAPGFSPMLPSPLHLAAMKLQAYRNRDRNRREQDWSDLVQLVRNHLSEISRQEFEPFVIRHGGPEAWLRLAKEIQFPAP